MMLFERVCDHLNEGNFESRVVSAVINLNLALKAFGPQADVLFKEQVDKLQVRTLNSVTIFFHRNKLIRFCYEVFYHEYEVRTWALLKAFI